MFPTIQRTRMLSPTPGERTHERVIQIFAYFLAVWGMGSFGRMAVTALGKLIAPHAEPSVRLLIDLLGTLTAIIAVLLWLRLFERRGSVGMGFVKQGAVAEYAVGMVGGAFLFGGAVALCMALGIADITVSASPPVWWLLVLFFVGFLIQGMSEELLCRSFLMISLSRMLPLWVCAAANAAIFSLLHLFNAGISPIALVNIFLFGLLASVLTLKRGSIWMAASLHSLWNFTQGNLFGIPVSGITDIPAPLTANISDDSLWHRLIGGGSFGMEGGLATTLVLIVGILVVMMVPGKKREIAESHM